MKLHPALLIILLASLGQQTMAQDGSAVQVRRIGGLAVVRGEIETPAGAVGAHFALDFGAESGLTLPPDTAAGLGLKPKSSCAVKIGALRLPLVVIDENAKADVVRGINADHATELEQIPIVGVLGAAAFAGRTLDLDLEAGVLHLDTASTIETGNVPMTSYARQPNGPIRLTVGKIVIGLDMLRLESQIGLSSVESLKLGQPDAAKIDFGGADLLSSDAFRPTPLNSPGSADVLLGVRWLSRVRMTVTPERVTFHRLRPAEPATAEQTLLLAQWRGDANALAAFLKSAPDGPLSNDAAMALLGIRLNDQNATPEATHAAVDAVAASFPVSRRAHRLVGLTDQLLSKPTPRTRLVAGQLLDAAAAVAKEDLDGRAIYEVHARQGRLALDAGDIGAARRLLIAAAYGLPGDARVNVDLGDLYARAGQQRRAFSRYLDAALATDPPAAATRGLDRLWNDPATRTAMSVGEIEILLEGRTPATPPATQPASGTFMELITDDGNPGDLGPALAFDALRSGGGKTIFLSFHFGPAGNTALAAARAKFYGLRSVPAVVRDGSTIDNTAADAAEGPALIASYTSGNTFGKNAPTTQPLPSLVIDATWGDKEIAINASAEHAGVHVPSQARLYLFACEPTVFAIGGNGIAVHHAVARAALGDETGYALPDNGPWKWNISVDRAALSRVPVEGDAAREQHPPGAPAMKTTRPDMNSCFVVAILQEPSTHRVLAATVARPNMKGHDE